jgi:hypothetical protein
MHSEHSKIIVNGIIEYGLNVIFLLTIVFPFRSGYPNRLMSISYYLLSLKSTQTSSSHDTVALDAIQPYPS